MKIDLTKIQGQGLTINGNVKTVNVIQRNSQDQTEQQPSHHPPAPKTIQRPVFLAQIPEDISIAEAARLYEQVQNLILSTCNVKKVDTHA